MRKENHFPMREEAMNDPFEKKVWAAAVAGWWAVLIAYVLLVLVWLVYLGIISAKPAWLMTLWGEGEVSWGLVQTVSLWFMGVFKLCIWLMIVVVLWLTLWARQLHKLNQQGTK
jgi:hypothetical protein